MLVALRTTHSKSNHLLAAWGGQVIARVAPLEVLGLPRLSVVEILIDFLAVAAWVLLITINCFIPWGIEAITPSCYGRLRNVGSDVLRLRGRKVMRSAIFLAVGALGHFRLLVLDLQLIPNNADVFRNS